LLIEHQVWETPPKSTHTRGKTLDTQPNKRYRFVLIAKRISAGAEKRRKSAGKRGEKLWPKKRKRGKIRVRQFAIVLRQIVNAQHSRLAFSFWLLPRLIVLGIIIVSSSSLLFFYSPTFPAFLLYFLLCFFLLFFLLFLLIFRLLGGNLMLLVASGGRGAKVSL